MGDQLRGDEKNIPEFSSVEEVIEGEYEEQQEQEQEQEEEAESQVEEEMEGEEFEGRVIGLVDDEEEDESQVNEDMEGEYKEQEQEQLEDESESQVEEDMEEEDKEQSQEEDDESQAPVAANEGSSNVLKGIKSHIRSTMHGTSTRLLLDHFGVIDDGTQKKTQKS